MTESPALAAALTRVHAVFFDLDGVVTDTAELRAAAWKQLFDDDLQDPWLLAATGGAPVNAGDYRDLVAGRTREDAVTTFTVDLPGRLKAGRIPVVLATSARDAAPLLAAAGLEDVFDHISFDHISDRQTALDRGVAGKPTPALHLDAVRRLQMPPGRLRVPAAPDDTAPVRAGTGRVLLRAGQEHEFLITDG